MNLPPLKYDKRYFAIPEEEYHSLMEKISGAKSTDQDKFASSLYDNPTKDKMVRDIEKIQNILVETNEIVMGIKNELLERKKTNENVQSTKTYRSDVGKIRGEYKQPKSWSSAKTPKLSPSSFDRNTIDDDSNRDSERMMQQLEEFKKKVSDMTASKDNQALGVKILYQLRDSGKYDLDTDRIKLKGRWLSAKLSKNLLQDVLTDKDSIRSTKDNYSRFKSLLTTQGITTVRRSS